MQSKNKVELVSFEIPINIFQTLTAMLEKLECEDV